MKLYALALLSALQLSGVAADRINARHVYHARQAAPPGSSVPAPPPTTSTGAPPPPPPNSPSQSSLPTLTPTTTGPPPLDTGTTIHPLANITSGMPTKAPPMVTAIYTPGAKPPLSGAPPLPSARMFVLGTWPPQDKVPPTDSPEVQAWLKELNGHTIPSFSPTVDGSCGGDPAAAADAANRGWWTCGGHTRDTDIVACPDKLTWGVSFDDGPSPYSINLLTYLDDKDLSATFFVVGSRVIERPNILIQEYMSGHEISVHTWSHRPLTTLTNEQIVAELGWTRKAIKTVLGVTPTTMRPPYGDIDDRVRAISLAMGMVPIMWTRTPDGGKFDTNDWRVAGGIVNGTESFETFNQILSNATSLNTGFIVLQHDLFEITVDLARGFTLDAALNHQPKFNLQSIGECLKFPPGNLYLETNQNQTFPYRNSATGGGVDVSGDGTIDTKSGDGGATDPGNTGGAMTTGPALMTAALVSLVFSSLLL
ncbi:hypothetical protein BJ165DRAFT_1337898 [Panaeolus papilionaceus]|nr:hypothetical protein BJ165DRAFT_1337898 [Panaeolus papilionaceus]